MASFLNSYAPDAQWVEVNIGFTSNNAELIARNLKRLWPIAVARCGGDVQCSYIPASGGLGSIYIQPIDTRASNGADMVVPLEELLDLNMAVPVIESGRATVKIEPRRRP